MKKILIGLTTVLTVTGAVCANADITSCMSNYVHCAYSTDPAGQNNAGYWVKFTDTTIGKSGTMCMPLGSSLAINNYIINHNPNLYPMGSNTWVFQLCSDSSCTTTLPLLTDNFTLAKNQNAAGYTANPSTASFSMLMVGTTHGYSSVQCPSSATANIVS